MEYRIDEEKLSKLAKKKPNWIIHGVLDNGSFKPYRCDFHTHGLDKYDSKELQLTIAINPQTACFTINSIGLLIRNGEKFQAGDKIFGLYDDPEMSIGFIDAKDSAYKDVLRICLPDKNGKVFPNEAEGIFKEQGTDPYFTN